MTRTRYGRYILLVMLAWPIWQYPNSYAQKKIECSASLPSGVFSGDVDIKILVTGFGYPDDRADLFMNRYLAMLQSYISVPKISENSSALSTKAAQTIQGRIVRYLPCEVSTHSTARQLGQQLGADLVL